jgi:TadE-like protein
MAAGLGIFQRLSGLVREERGGTLAEMALTVPFLILLLAGVAEFGRMFQTYTTVIKSTRSAARYLSNHQYNPLEVSRAKNLAVCGKLTACAEGEELAKGLSVDNICIKSTFVPDSTQIEAITVSVPREESVTCDGDETATYLLYAPIFDIGGLMGSETFSLAYPINSSTTMRYIP